ENPQILMKTGKSNLGLEGIELECSCGAKANMKGAFMRLKNLLNLMIMVYLVNIRKCLNALVIRLGIIKK
ncbi:hypothetical protein, partial [Clostridioides difficile]|uniref:hypothetical protein n=1 Tax=Clostridioides difficile TaxID=1496 RepID=UPI0015DD7436